MFISGCANTPALTILCEASSTNVYLGGRNGGDYFNGAIGEFRRLTSYLSASAVQEMYDETVGHYSSFVAPSVVKIDRIVPSAGTSAGGNVVTLKGWNLETVS